MNIFRSAIALFLSCLCISSVYAYNNGPYLGAELGYGGSEWGSGGGGRLLIGEQFNRFFALEIAGTDIPNAQSNWFDDDYHGKFYSLDSDAKLMLPIGNHFNFFLRGGPSLGYINESDRYGSREGTKGMWNLGTGMNVNFTQHFSSELFLQAIGQPSENGALAALAGVGISYHFSDDGDKNTKPVAASTADTADNSVNTGM